MNSKLKTPDVGFVYLIQPATLINTNRYKIGCSRDMSLARLQTYLYGSKFICVHRVNKPFEVEKHIKNTFINNHYIPFAGNEYFQGDETMLNVLFLNTLLNMLNNNLFSYTSDKDVLINIEPIIDVAENNLDSIINTESVKDYKTEFYEKNSITYRDKNINYNEQINLINYKKSNNLEFTCSEFNIIIITLFKALNQLVNFTHDITDNLIENVESLKELKDIKEVFKEVDETVKLFKNIEDNCKQELVFIYEHINFVLNQVKNDMDTFPVKNHVPLYTDICCEYKEYCNDCRVGTTRKDDYTKYTYCNDCYICNHIRNCKKKEDMKEAEQLWLSKNRKDKISINVNVTNDSNNINNITVNNTIINNVSITQINYVHTSDRFFEVILTNNNIEMYKKLFVQSMCGVNGTIFFPNDIAGTSTTFNPVAATYAIKYIDDKPILQGIIRYGECKGNTSITENKLMSLNKTTNPSKKVNITVRRLNLWEGEKNKHDIDDIKSVYEEIKKHNMSGCELNDFIK